MVEITQLILFDNMNQFKVLSFSIASVHETMDLLRNNQETCLPLISKKQRAQQTLTLPFKKRLLR